MCITLQSHYHYRSSTRGYKTLQAVNMMYTSLSILRSTFNIWIWFYCKSRNSPCEIFIPDRTPKDNYLHSISPPLHSCKADPITYQSLPFPLLARTAAFSTTGWVKCHTAQYSTACFQALQQTSVRNTQYRICPDWNTPVAWNTRIV